MNEIDALKEQIELLKKLVSTQDLLIAEMRKSIPFISIPSIWTTPAVCLHEYPNPWGSTVPPHCKKCGQQAQSGTIYGGHGGASGTVILGQGGTFGVATTATTSHN